MPELPEVESNKIHLQETSQNKIIKNVEIRDDYVLKMPKDEFKKRIKDQKINGFRRHGKWLFLKLNSENLLLHFGMSGYVQYFDVPANEPEYSKILFEFEEGGYLSYISVRKLGEVKLIKDIDDFIKEEDLGPDACDISQEQFLAIMDTKGRSYAKSALMDQSAVAGIGNIFSDEILFQTKIYPKTRVSTINKKKCTQIFDSMKEILKVAIKAKLNDDSLPDEWLISHRSKKGTCPICSSEIRRISVSGRHGYYCPKCQQKPD
ncbi:MAG: putative Formamidopyrimidine-DNA glycosylase [Promethearchaeota archaeon]|nr:MAG: putative Formamidopyrimidine-DNA glycosylase [Candidatus Lokiarchaeota archaeon]